MKIITIANHKGGVGKTTTAVTLATGLAGLGYKTVLIDCDVQGHVAPFLGMERRRSLYEFIIQEKAPDLQTIGNLSVLAGNEWTAEVGRSLDQSQLLDKNTAIRESLKRLPPETQIVLIDTAPSVAAVQLSAINAADWLLIPAIPEFASEAGIMALSKMVAKMREKRISTIDLLGILPTMVQTRRTEHQTTLDDWAEKFGSVMLSRVRNLTELGEAPGHHLPIWRYAPNSQAAKDYGDVLLQVKERLGLRNGKG